MIREENELDLDQRMNIYYIFTDKRQRECDPYLVHN